MSSVEHFMRFKFNTTLSLKTRVSLFTLLIFLLGMWSLAVFATYTLRQDMQRILGEQQFAAASSMAEKINQELKLRLQLLETLAATGKFSFSQGAAALQSRLEDRPMLNALFSGGVIAMRPDGTVVAEVPRAAERLDVSYLGVENVVIALQQGKSVIGRPVQGKKLHAPVFGITVPLRGADGNVLGTISGVTNLGRANFLDAFSQDRGDQAGYMLLVAPQHGVIITSSDKRRVMESVPQPGRIPAVDRFLQGYDGSQTYVNPLGVEVLSSSKGVPTAGWRVVLTMSTAQAFAPIYAMQQRMLFATLVITLLAGGLTWWMLRYQLAPLRRAAAQVRSLVGVPLPLPPLALDRPDEIGELVAGFNDLLARLGQVDEARKEAEFRWNFAMADAGIGVWNWNIVTGAARYSAVWRKMLGYNENDGLSTTQEWQHLIHPDDYSRVMQATQAYLSGAAPAYLVEYRLRRSDQTYHWAQSRGVVVRRSADGTPLRMMGVHADIHQRKLAELALQERSAELNSLLDTTLDGFLKLDAQGRIVEVNPTMCLQSGYSREELLAMHVSDIEALEAASEIKARVESLRRQGRGQFETQHRRKDGSIWHVEVSATFRHADDPSIVAFLRDISTRRVAELALAESEAFLRTVIDTGPECIKIVDSQGRLQQMNPAGLTMIEADSLAQVLGLEVKRLISPRYRRAFADLHQRVLSGETGELVFEVIGLKGRRRWMDTRATPMLFKGEVVQLATTRDITERKLSEAALRVAAVAFESQEGMMITDPNGVIQRVNRAFTDTTGYTSEEVVGKTPRLLQSGRHDQAFYRDMWSSIQRKGYWSGEVWDRRKNGEVYPKWLNISAVRDAGGAITHYIGSHHEITDRKNAETALRQLNATLFNAKQDLRALAARSEARVEYERKHIAREVHDELGQVMTALRMSLSLAAMRYAVQAPDLADELKDMKLLVDRAIRGVRNVASNLRPAALDMGLIAALEWLCSEFSQHSGVSCRLHRPLENIDLNEARAVVIFRIVQESLTNIARYAHAAQVSVTMGLSGNELGVEVRDDGCGFSVADAAQRKTFGLLGMRERAAALGGHVDVISAPGQGTVIGVTIPMDGPVTAVAP